MTPAALKAARESFGPDMTQERWADVLGVGRSYIGKIETKGARPSPTLVKLVEAYLRHGLPDQSNLTTTRFPPGIGID